MLDKLQIANEKLLALFDVSESDHIDRCGATFMRVNGFDIGFATVVEKGVQRIDRYVAAFKLAWTEIAGPLVIAQPPLNS